MASRSARARCAFVVNCVSPTHTPRASGRHLGANRPENAGTKYTPPASGTEAASGSTSLADRINPRLSLSHWTPAPAMATLPSSAYAGVASLPSRHAIVVSSPCLDSTTFPPVLRSMKQPVPYVFLAPPAPQRWPSVAACWSPRHPVSLTPFRAPSAMTPYSSAHDTMRGRESIGTPNFTAVGSCQVWVRRSMSMVRDALVASVTCVPAEPVSLCSSQLSMVPKARSFSAAAALTASRLSRSQRIFTPEK
mmetsp:Transcript_1349/g.5497  ORF Transcript_1349/g.5497 Transcript_1349/m.5497 type:complete len:250 (+) Transcript_1349:415-1164(+)